MGSNPSARAPNLSAHVDASAWWRGRLPVAVAVGASVGLAFLAFRNVEIGDVARTIAGVRLRWLPMMVGVLLGDLCVRSLRWRILLSGASSRVDLWALVRLEAIGLAVNNLLLLRLGEVIRAYLGAKELGIPVMTCLATIALERALDMLTLTFLFAISARLEPSLVPAAFGWSAVAAVGAMVVALAVLVLAENWLRTGTVGRFLSGYPRLFRFIEQAIEGARALRSWRSAVPILALGASLWLMDALLYWSGGRAIGLAPPLGYGRSLLVLCAAAASSFLPAAPGSFGAFEQAVKVFLVHSGWDGSIALAYAGFVHVLNYGVITGLGLVFLYRAELSLAGLRDLGRGVGAGKVPT